MRFLPAEGTGRVTIVQRFAHLWRSLVWAYDWAGEAAGTTRILCQAAFELALLRPLRFQALGGPREVKPRTAKIAKKSGRVSKIGSVNSLAPRQDVWHYPVFPSKIPTGVCAP